MRRQGLRIDDTEESDEPLQEDAGPNQWTRAGDAMMKDMFIKRRNLEQRLYEKYSRAEENVD